jgi:hypothetical protein
MRGCDYINLLSCRVLSFPFLKKKFRELSTRPLPASVYKIAFIINKDINKFYNIIGRL